MARDLSPLLPETFNIIFAVRRCGGAPHDYFPGIHTVTVALEDIDFTDDDINNAGQPEGIEGAVMTFRDTALSLFDTAAGPPSNLDALTALAEQIAGDWADWATWSIDETLNGIAAVQPCALLDTIEFRYDAVDCFTRITSQPWNGGAIELQHMDPAVSATDCRAYDRAPGILLDIPGGAMGQSMQAVLALEDGRLVAKYDSAGSVSCGCNVSCSTTPVCFGVYDFCDFNKPVPVLTPIYGTEISLYNAPQVVFTGGGGIPPIAYATVAGGAVTGITILDGGCCYSVAPTISFIGGGGSGAAATATIDSQVVQSLVFTGSVTSITVTNGGAGYSHSSPPAVALSAPLISPTSVQATATATVNTSGVVTGISVTNAGAGYEFPPVVSIASASLPAQAGTVTLAGNAVTAIAVATGGYGYIVAPTVSIFGGGGSGATATASISGGIVTSIGISAGGTGYTSTPSVVISSPSITASGTAVLTGGSVSGITLVNGGAGYVVAPTVSFSGGGGAGAHATASISSGAVSGFSITAGGGGYGTPPTVTIGPPEVQATATAHISSGTGSGYTSDPTLSFSGGGGSGAKAVPYAATTGPLSLASLNLIDPGTGYTSVPSVSITGGGGAGATATAVLSGGGVTAISVTGGGSGYATTGLVDSCTVTGTVTNVVVTSGGTGYTSAPTVIFTGGGGSGAAATATLGGNSVLGFSNVYPTTGAGYSGTVTVSFTGGGGSGATGVGVLGGGGVITSVTITSAGTGYTGSPTVSFSGAGGSGASGIATVNLVTHHVTGVNFSTTGGGYIMAPTVTISGGGGSGATAHALINGSGAVSDVIIDMGGSGYTSLPSVTFSGGGGSGASVTPILANDGNIASITVTNGGSGYLTPPTVSFSGGGGTSAGAHAVLTPKCCLMIPAAGTYLLVATDGAHYVPLVISVHIDCGSNNVLLIVPRPTFTVTTPSSCDPSLDETPTVTILNGSTVVASGPAGTPFIDEVTPGITYTITATEDSAYPWYQWLVKSYKVTGCMLPNYVLNPEGVTLFPLFNSTHSAYACTCFSPEPIALSFSLTDNWLNTTCALTPGGDGGFYAATCGSELGPGASYATGIATSVALPYINPSSVVITNPGSGYTFGAVATFSGGTDRNGNPIILASGTPQIGGADHHVTGISFINASAWGYGYTSAPTITITPAPPPGGGAGFGSGATATISLEVGNAYYALVEPIIGECVVVVSYGSTHTGLSPSCCAIPYQSTDMSGGLTGFIASFGGHSCTDNDYILDDVITVTP